MFNLFKNKNENKLQKEFEKKLAEATEAQRNGNIERYAQLTAEAEELLKKIEQIEKK
jgi:hypothetical protein